MRPVSNQSDPRLRSGSGEVQEPKVTLAEFADGWLEQQRPRLRPNSYRIYSSYLHHHINPRLGNRELATITVDDVADLVAEMEQGTRLRLCDGVYERELGGPFAAATIRGVLTVLARVLGRAARRGLISSNPVHRLEKEDVPKAARRVLPSLDRAAIGKLITETPKRFRPLVAVAVLTGIRQSEMLGLRWQDVELDPGLLHIRNQLNRNGQLVEPKTSASKRDVPIPPSLGRMLDAHRQEAIARGYGKSTDFVFASSTGGAVSRRNIVRRGLNRALQEANLPKLTWHDLRHVAASALIAEGASVPYLARVLGHASPAITLAVYAHEFAQAEHAHRTRQQMEAAFGEFIQ